MLTNIFNILKKEININNFCDLNVSIFTNFINDFYLFNFKKY